MENQKPKNPKVDKAFLDYTREHSNQGVKHDLITLLAVVVGATIIGLNMKIFLSQANMLPAGINGVATLIQRLIQKYLNIKVPFVPISISLNLIPGIMAYRTVGKKFTLFSCVAILILSFATDFIPKVEITKDWLLIAVFGGILNGFANSLILRREASTGGFDFLAMYFSVKKGVYTFNYVFLANAFVILLSGIFFGADSALYTVIYQYVSTQMIGLMYKRYSKKTLFIITDSPYEVSEGIMAATHHACTIFEGEGSYTGAYRKIVYSVIGANDLDRVRGVIKTIDPKSFVNTIDSNTIMGNFYQRPIG